MEFGRTAILTSQYAHCGCLWSEANTLTEESKSDLVAGKTKKNNTGAKLNLCRRCREAESWCVRFLSRKLMRITPVAPPAVHKNPTPDCTCNDCTSDYTHAYRVQIRGENTLQFVSIDGSECMAISNNCNGDDSDSTRETEWKTVGTGSSQTHELVVTLGSIISFRYPGENSAARGGGERSSKSLHFQLCLVSVSETEFASGVHVETAVQSSGNPKDCQAQAHDTSMGMDGSDDAGKIGSNPLTQRPGISTPRIGQSGNDSESQVVLAAVATAPAACLSPNAGSGSAPNASSSSSTEEVPSSLPQNHQEAACMPPALSPHCRPRRSPLSRATSPQTSPTSTEGASSCPPPRQLSTVDHQEPSPVDSTVRESTTSNLETGAPHPRAAVSSDGSQDPALGSALISQGPQLSTALHDDTNTPRAASQRSIIDLMTPESWTGAGSNAPLTLRKDDGDQESSQRSTGVDMEATPTDAAAARRIVFFLKLGRGMAQSRIQLLSKTLEKKNADVRIVESFASSPAPTHVVMDPNIDLSDELASSLGFNSAEGMASHFCSKKIHAVTPHWVLTCTCENLQDDPGIDCLWGGFRRYQSAESIKTKVRGTCKSKKRQIPSKNGWTKSRKVAEHSPANAIKPSILPDDDTSMDRVTARKHGLDKESIASPSVGAASHSAIRAMRGDAPKRNVGLSAMFDELADLQKQSALEKLDEWRAYTYTIVASRLRQLEFEVTPNPDILGSVRSIRGFGSGVMEKIKQFLATGTCEKLNELKVDPARVAVRELCQIHGVGPKTASQLVNRGYRCIADVRRGLASGDIDILSDSARVGVDCYEDFLEKMERSEVKLIGDIVSAAVYRYWPEAEVSTMGSYRRGKPQSGDADILIVHPGFVSSTPKNALARILKLLERDGRITNHLTSVKGAFDDVLSNDSQLSCGQDSQYDQEKLSVDDEYRAATTKRSLNIGDDNPGSVSWMGVFRSPVHEHEGKRRRVDIKMYPYREKAFVSLR